MVALTHASQAHLWLWHVAHADPHETYVNSKQRPVKMKELCQSKKY